MRKVPMMLFLIVALNASMAAQDRNRFEVFGGYSLEHVAPCGTSFGGCVVEGSPLPSVNFNGWNAAVTGYFYRSLGVTADFSGHYAGNVMNNGFDLGSVHRYTYLFGPTYAIHLQRATVFARALFGGISEGAPTTVIHLDYNEFMWAVGGGLDVILSRHFAVRPAQLDYERHGVASFGTGSNPTVPTNGLRYSAGLVLRF